MESPTNPGRFNNLIDSAKNGVTPQGPDSDNILGLAKIQRGLEVFTAACEKDHLVTESGMLGLDPRL